MVQSALARGNNLSSLALKTFETISKKPSALAIFQGMKKIIMIGVPGYSRLRTLYNVHEDVGLIPGSTQWIKDLALLWAVV